MSSARLGGALLALRARDQGLVVTRQALRTAIVMPAVFFVGLHVLDNPAFATFAAFGAFSKVLLVSFTGPLRDRALYQLLLALTGAVLVASGTLLSRWTWAAALAMAAVAFVVHFSGVVSSVLASVGNALLLAFILAVSLPAPAAEVPDHVAGWLAAGGAALVANLLLWPAPSSDPLRSQVITSCRLLGRRLRVGVAFARQSPGTTLEDRDVAAADARTSVATMLHAFFRTPYRPTALTTSARATVRLVDELAWVSAVLDQSPPDGSAFTGTRLVCEVKEAAATVLEQSGELLAGPGVGLGQFDEDVLRLRASLARMAETAANTLPVESPRESEGQPRAGLVVSSLEPTFRAQEISFGVGAIAENARIAAVAEERNSWERLMGRQPPGLVGPLRAAQGRATSHFDRHSVWLQNSIRVAVALAVAVAVAAESGLQHSFWVVLGTLSVLRSNALSTGQNIAAALGGTVVGLIVGSTVVLAIGTNEAVLWVLLPFAICFAGLAPALIGFAAGQAAFSIALLIVFNLIAPAGWRIGVVRLTDIVIGSVVSLVVGLLFWPRGAAAALRHALAEAYEDSADYLRKAAGAAAAVEGAANIPAAKARAAAAARRLDDAFRQLLNERGAQHVPLPDVTRLVTGVVALRLAADAMVGLWAQGDDPEGGGARASRAEIAEETVRVTGWYDGLASALRAGSGVPDPVVADDVAQSRLVDAVRRDLRGDAGPATSTAVRLIWTADHLDAMRQLQGTMLAPAALAVAQPARLADLRLMPKFARHFPG